MTKNEEIKQYLDPDIFGKIWKILIKNGVSVDERLDIKSLCYDLLVSAEPFRPPVKEAEVPHIKGDFSEPLFGGHVAETSQDDVEELAKELSWLVYGRLNIHLNMKQVANKLLEKYTKKT